MSSHKSASKHNDFSSSSSRVSTAVPLTSAHDTSTAASLPTSHQPLDADPALSNEEEDETSQSTLPSSSHRRPHPTSHLSAHHPHSSGRPASPPASSPPSSQPDAELDSADDSEDDGSDSYGSEDDYAWIPWFCALKGNEFFCEVDEEFAQDAFNLTGLEQLVPYFDQALDMILDVELADVMNEETQEVIENDAENLFGLIHARYIITSRGLQAMLDKYRLFHFGRCPRVLCRGQAVLPIGLSDTPNEDSVKLYCPRCEEIYGTKSPRHEHIDGAYFGTTFAHLFYLTFPELKVSKSKEYYIPRVFGFKIHKSAYKRSLEMRKREKEREKERRKREQQSQPGQQPALAAGEGVAGAAGQAAG